MVSGMSQELFDDIVKENTDDFDMPYEEALEDAVKQVSTNWSILMCLHDEQKSSFISFSV